MYSARQKLKTLLDEGSFKELWQGLCSRDYLGFVDYQSKLQQSAQDTGEKEAVICGLGKIGTYRCVIAVFELGFMMGSMGIAAGEKIARAFEIASRKRLPIIIITASSGMRLQEGTLALLQMAKTVEAAIQHSKKNLLFIAVVCDPTLGGVSASFTALADIIIAERGSRFGFTGKRVIEETFSVELEPDFQKVISAESNGFVDIAINFQEIRDMIIRILKLHC